MKNALKWLFGPVQNYWDSFKIAEGGFSQKKMMAHASMWCMIYGNYAIFHNLTSFSQLAITTLIIDVCAFSLAAGIATVAELIKFKNGGTDTTTTTATATVTTTTPKPDANEPNPEIQPSV